MYPKMISLENCSFCVSVLCLCVLWSSVSTSGSLLNKIILRQYHYPWTVSMSSLLSVSLYSIPMIYILKLNTVHLSIKTRLIYILPIGIGKALALILTFVSLANIPVSYLHTVKATNPIFAVLCARIILDEVQSFNVYMSLIPIVCGVAIASITELSFNFTGLVTALSATLTYALLNTYSKRVFKDVKLHPLQLLEMSAQVATLTFLPFWCLHDILPLWREFHQTEASSFVLTPSLTDFLVKLLLSGTLTFIQDICILTLIHKLTALSFAVTSAAKRITVVVVSLFVLRNPVTLLNIFGMLLAIFGVFGYNQAKQSEARGLKHVPFKPLVDIVNYSDFNLVAMALSEGSKMTKEPFIDSSSDIEYGQSQNNNQTSQSILANCLSSEKKVSISIDEE